jgi:anti-sigma factor RsiW
MTQFDELEGQPNGCAVCEAMLPEAVDGTLTETEQQAFDRHVAGCVRCSLELAEAQRGAAWLSMLKTKAPEPPTGLLERILAETSGAAVPAQAAIPLIAQEPRDEWATPYVPARSSGGWNSRWAAARMKLSEVFSFDATSAIFQPRLAMTAAMAFFSLALTLNLTGVRLRDLRAANFSPSGVKRTVADAGASATRQFENLRVVYQLESRVSELRSDEAR